MLESVRDIHLSEMDSRFNAIAEKWSDKNGIQIHLQPKAARLLSQKALESGDSLEDIFSEIFENFEYGLKLIRQSQGIQEFEITPEVVNNPKSTLDEWIKSQYAAGRSQSSLVNKR